MNPLKRFLFQVLLWFLVWLSVGIESHFFRINGPTFLLQSATLLCLIFFAVPKLLFKNKLLIFLLFTVLLIILSTYVLNLLDPPNVNRVRSFRANGQQPLMSSRFFRQMIIITVTCLIAVIIETVTMAQQKQKSEALAKAELKESELKFLKMQINPHFLFNSLNNIYALSVTNSDKTQAGIHTLSLMLRYVLYESELPKVSLSKELEYIRHFIELFKLKSSEEYNIKFIEDIKSENIMIAPMLLVPFIENSFKHSGIEKRGNSFVNISLGADDKKIEFSVENSLPSEQLITDSHGGIGLENVKKRLNILYPETHILDIKKTNTFKVMLKINLERF